MGNTATRLPAGTVSIGIVAHTTRTAAAQNLAHQTGAGHIAYDDGSLGCEDNHWRIWHWHTQHHTEWSVTLEDDAQPVPDFPNQLEQALTAAPTPIVSLYLGKQCPLQHGHGIDNAITRATDDDAHWILSNQLFHAVGVAIKTALLPSLLTSHTGLPADEHIGWWARQQQLGPIAYTWPSLVDHADGPTIAKHRDKLPRPTGRTAYHTGTRTHWTNQAVTT